MKSGKTSVDEVLDEGGGTLMKGVAVDDALTDVVLVVATDEEYTYLHSEWISLLKVKAPKRLSLSLLRKKLEVNFGSRVIFLFRLNIYFKSRMSQNFFLPSMFDPRLCFIILLFMFYPPPPF